MCAFGAGFQKYGEQVARIKQEEEAKRAGQVMETKLPPPKCELCGRTDTELETYGGSLAYLACKDVTQCESNRA